MDFQIIGPIRETATIAVGAGVRDTPRLRRMYGGRRWRKRTGIATIQESSGRVRQAEIHWYEAQGIGKRDVKVKRFLDEAS